MDNGMINESNAIKKIDAYIALKMHEEEEINNPKEWRITAKQNRERFVAEYPIERIKLLTIDEYCKGDNSFTKKIRIDLQGLASMGNAYPDTFGLYVKKETNEIVLSKTFQKISNGNVEIAFNTIKDEIVRLLTGFNSIGFDAVNNIHLNNMYIYKLLIIYYPDKLFPVCARGTLQKYCECVGLSFNSKDEMYVGIKKLLEWKTKVEAFKYWDNAKLMSFCDWLVRSNQSIDGNELIHGKGSIKNVDKGNTTYWFISGNPDKFNLIDAFHDLGKIDWKQSANFEVGDVVYIYVSSKIQRIMFKCKVNKVNLETAEIHDGKYNISGEYDGTYGRYMELEMIEEFDTDLYSRTKLEKYGFTSPQGPVRVSAKVIEYIDVVQYLLHVDEMDPDKHDGSYELARETVRAYKNMNNINAVDYLDLNLLYHMVIGTWKLKVDLKKKSIDKSHLPENEKDRLKNLLDKVWKNAENGEYECRESGDASIGMFGTGFYSFNSSDNGEAAKAFIKLCIELLEMTDDEEMYKAVERYFYKEYLGLKAASATVMLHCLKPFTFPILNTNFGSNTIYEFFGIELYKFKNLTTLANNFRKIKEFRDSHFKVKNYIIYDRAARMVNKDVSDIEQEEYWPSAEDYPVNLTKDDWKRFLNDVEYPKHKGCMRVLKCYLENDGISSPTRMSEMYGGHSMVYTGSISNTCRRALKYFDMQPCPDNKKEDTQWLFPIAFQGKSGEGPDEGTYVYKMRPELLDALKDMNLDDIELFYRKETVDMGTSLFDKNIILYGPPGTGKTYSSVLYAVGICEGVPIEDLQQENYEEVLTRFNQYREEGRIAFTTFHQSYGYEEFIEGIKPVVDESEEEISDIGYTIEDGLFKKFCSRALLPSDSSDSMSKYGLNRNPNVWKVSLEGTGDNPIRTECIENDHIRIGWDDYGEIITDDTDFSTMGGKVVLNSFINKMQIGDIVLSCYSASTVDAIGVVTGEYEWRPEYEAYKRLRNVKWLAKGINYNILEVNGGSSMTLATVYKMKVSVSDVFKILDEVGVSSDYASNVPLKNHVFIIDEINRGNISKIFGELITLIEESKRLGSIEELELELPYSKKKFGVPGNVYIVGTMNTADRSIALMDTALRRRFSFVEMMPDTKVLDGVVVEEDGESLDVAKLLEVINTRIEYLYDREHTIGHAFFVPLIKAPTINKLADIFDKNVIPLLKEYFYEDYSKIQLVLGDNKKSSDEYKFIKGNSLDIRDIFNGDTSDLDLPEQTYKLQTEALYKIMSYKEISKDL